MAVTNTPTEPAVAEDATATEEAPAVDQTTTTGAPARRRFWARRRFRRPRGRAVPAADTAPPVASARPSARTRVAAVGAETSVMLARAIKTIAAIVALIIALGIAFVVLKATPTNTIVSHVHSWAKWLVGPFDGMFHVHSPRATTAVNWGIALLVYLAIGSILARLVASPARAFRRHTPAV